MEHWIIAVVAPLTELNPVKYALDPSYRASAAYKLGHRAKRILIYQVLVAVAVSAVIAPLLKSWWLAQ
jgi:hypothetical protein